MILTNDYFRFSIYIHKTTIQCPLNYFVYADMDAYMDNRASVYIKGPSFQNVSFCDFYSWVVRMPIIILFTGCLIHIFF